MTNTLLLLCPLGVFFFSAAIFLLPRRVTSETFATPEGPAWRSWGAPATAVLAGLPGMVAAFSCLLSGQILEWRHVWALPFGSFHLRLDPLSAWFAVLLYAVAFLGAWHGGQKPVRRSNWSGYFLLCGGMLLLLLAWDAVLFLMAWEIMSLAAWILIMNRHTRPHARRAGWFYFIVTHASTACLMLMFALLWKHAHHSFSFNAFTGLALPAAAANAAFILAVIGFGSKAGFCGFRQKEMKSGALARSSRYSGR